MVDVLFTLTNWPAADSPITTAKVFFSLLAFTLVYLTLTIAFFIIMNVAKHVAGKTKTTLDDELIIVLQAPLQYGIILVSSYVFMRYLDRAFTVLDYPIGTVFKFVAVLLGGYTLDKLVKTTVKWYYTDPSAKSSKLREEVVPIISKSISVVIYASTLVVLLNQLGVEVAPLLAGLGIAGLAVALALQDSFTNFFSGMYILADRPIRVGDYIEIDDGGSKTALEGHVQEIGWRSVKLKKLSNDILILPNNKLATSIITNRALPDKESVASMGVGVAYDSDPDEVEKTIVEAFEEARKKLPKGRVPEKKPTVRFSDFGDSALMFRVLIPINDYTFQWEVLHEVRKEILKGFRRRKIEIPFPIRTVYTKRR